MKHPSAARSAGDRRAVFPGEIAGASLKHVLVRSTDAAMDVFPGEIAGASLKHSAGTDPSVNGW